MPFVCPCLHMHFSTETRVLLYSSALRVSWWFTERPRISARRGPRCARSVGVVDCSGGPRWCLGARSELLIPGSLAH